MRKSVLMILCVLAGVVLLQGCETVKGASKDIDNTAHNIGKLMNGMREEDNSFSNKYW